MPPVIPNQIPSVPGRDKGLPEIPGDTVDPEVVPENKPDWKSTAYATTKLAISMVKESSDAFPPLKSVAGGLSAILDHCDVRLCPGLNDSLHLCHPQRTVACRETVESLMPRVEQLAESLSGPVPDGEVKEEERRKILKRYFASSEVDALSNLHNFPGNWITSFKSSLHWNGGERSRGF